MEDWRQFHLRCGFCVLKEVIRTRKSTKTKQSSIVVKYSSVATVVEHFLWGENGYTSIPYSARDTAMAAENGSTHVISDESQEGQIIRLPLNSQRLTALQLE